MSTKTQAYIQGAEEMRELCARLIEQLYKRRTSTRQATPTAGWAQLVRCLPVGGVIRARNFSPPDIPLSLAEEDYIQQLKRREDEYQEAKLKADYAQYQRQDKRQEEDEYLELLTPTHWDALRSLALGPGSPVDFGSMTVSALRRHGLVQKAGIGKIEITPEGRKALDWRGEK